MELYYVTAFAIKTSQIGRCGGGALVRVDDQTHTRPACWGVICCFKFLYIVGVLVLYIQARWCIQGVLKEGWAAHTSSMQE